MTSFHSAVNYDYMHKHDKSHHSNCPMSPTSIRSVQKSFETIKEEAKEEECGRKKRGRKKLEDDDYYAITNDKI